MPMQTGKSSNQNCFAPKAISTCPPGRERGPSCVVALSNLGGRDDIHDLSNVVGDRHFRNFADSRRARETSSSAQHQ